MAVAMEFKKVLPAGEPGNLEGSLHFYRQNDQPSVAADEDLPSVLRKLAPRERAVATLVYRRGALTAAEITASLMPPISNSAVRTMLGRLISKGVLTRHRSGYGKTFIYICAAQNRDVAEIAFKRLTEDYFAGSDAAAAKSILAFLSRQAAKQKLCRAGSAENGPLTLVRKFKGVRRKCPRRSG